MARGLSKVLKFLLLPRIVPRSARLFGEWTALSWMLAVCFERFALLPPSFNYRGQGLAEIFVEALEFTRPHKDKRIILFAFFAGGVVMTTVMVLLAFSLLIPAARAAGMIAPYVGMFQSDNPTDDIAYILLDKVFGVPGLTGSCVQNNLPCLGAEYSEGLFPSPASQAFRGLLGFYSKSLLGIAALLLCYHFSTLVMETTRTGKPFGDNFSAVAILRVIIGVGLLFPAGQGLGGAQWTALYVAKLGSGFASSAWTKYVHGAKLSPTNTLAGDATTLIAMPNVPVANEVVEFIATARVCQAAYALMYKRTIDAYLMPDITGGVTLSLQDAMHTYNSVYGLQKYSGGAALMIVFGEYNRDKYAAERGKVHSYCGSITFHPPRMQDPGGFSYYDGGDLISYSYLQQIVLYPWIWSKWFTDRVDTLYPHPSFDVMAESINQVMLFNNHNFFLPTDDDKKATILWYNATVSDIVYDGYRAETDSSYSSVSGSVRPLDWANEEAKFGWAGAGIWYNRLMAENNIFSASVAALPEVRSYPAIMELVRTERQKAMPSVPGDNPFDPNLPGGFNIQFDGEKDQQIIHSMNASYALWNDFNEKIKPVPTGNAVYDGINSVFKTNGLMSLRNNREANPISALATLGKTLIDNAVAAIGGAGISGVMKLIGGKTVIGAVGGVAAQFLVFIGTICMTTGALLSYVVPLLPFIYFFFGVAGWLKVVVEAMFGVPLWALSMISFSGSGFFTKRSLSGLHIIFGVFLRPVLLLFGLVASMIVFTALFKVLQEIFSIVTSNLTGFDKAGAVDAHAGSPGSLSYIRGPVDQLAFSVIFTVTVYITALGSFKMIDAIPDLVLRWAGSAAASFGHKERGDAGGQLEGTLKKGVSGVGSSLNM